MSAINASLQGCVSSLTTSLSLLRSSITTFDSGVQDLPRLQRVLHTTRHFELLSESELQTAQSKLLSSIKPEVESLLGRVDSYLGKLERREQSLIAKNDLNEGRLGGAATTGGSERENVRPKSRAKSIGAAGDGEGLGPLEEMKLRQMRLKKERLSYAVERLNLQASQRERQLRMSMAAPQQGVLDDL